MKELKNVLEENQSRFNGKLAESSEVEALKEKFAGFEALNPIIEIIIDFPLIGIELILEEEDDESEVGGDLKWMAPAMQIEEAFHYLPGSAAIKKGFIPFAECLGGSGDPYFLQNNSGQLEVYRICHDFIGENDELLQEGIERVGTLATVITKGLSI